MCAAALHWPPPVPLELSLTLKLLLPACHACSRRACATLSRWRRAACLPSTTRRCCALCWWTQRGATRSAGAYGSCCCCVFLPRMAKASLLAHSGSCPVAGASCLLLSRLPDACPCFPSPLPTRSRYDFGPWPLLSFVRQLPPNVLQVLQNTEALFINGFVFDELPSEAVLAAATTARAAGAAVFFDPGACAGLATGTLLGAADGLRGGGQARPIGGMGIGSRRPGLAVWGHGVRKASRCCLPRSIVTQFGPLLHCLLPCRPAVMDLCRGPPQGGAAGHAGCLRCHLHDRR